MDRTSLRASLHRLAANHLWSWQYRSADLLASLPTAGPDRHPVVAVRELLSLERDVYPNYDIILCISTWSATAPLTEKCKIHGFRGAIKRAAVDARTVDLAVEQEGAVMAAHRVVGGGGGQLETRRPCRRPRTMAQSFLDPAVGLERDHG